MRIADVPSLIIASDHTDNSCCLLRFGEASHLLEALLDEARQVDHNLVASSLHLVILEQDVGSEQMDSLIDDVV